VFSPTMEVAACQDAITSGKYQAMIIASVIPTAGVACAHSAAAANIPVISTYGPIGTNTAIATPTVPDVASQVIVPLDSQLKALINRILVPACAKYNPCDLGWLRTTNSLPQADALLDTYLTAALHAHPNIKLIGQVSTDLNEGPAITATQQFLQKAPNLKAILSYGAVGLLGADIALRRAGKTPGKDVLIIGSGASESIMKLMRKGAVYGTTVNLPITEISESIKLAAEVARGMSVPSSVDPVASAHLPLVITQSNLGQYPTFKGQYLQ
jgi:ribose transport system substrate-binding protein